MNRLTAIGLIAIVLSGCISEAERRAQDAQQAYDRAYRYCMYGATGPFGSASIEVLRECQRQAALAAR